EGRRPAPQVGGKRAQQVAVGDELRLDHVGRLRRLTEHPGVAGARRRELPGHGVHASPVAAGAGVGARGRTGAVDPRTTSCGTKAWLGWATASWRRPAISIRAAWRAISSVACLAVVSAGHDWRENGLSSKPAIERS